jgi:hypothetical protein
LTITEYDDWLTHLVPFDLALGWGMLSEPIADQWIRWWQADRWYFYHYQPPTAGMQLPAHYIRDHSANVHIIPATPALEAAIRQLERNDVVLMQGLLVDMAAVQAGQSVAFRTSLSRTDANANSCEIFYVTQLTKASN